MFFRNIFNKGRNFIGALVFATIIGFAGLAQAVPMFDIFGPLPGATFGGSGIPNDAVAITTIVDGDNTITLGLTATERFVNPPVGNDGAGTFFAGVGTNNGTPGQAGNRAVWNVDFYIDVAGGGTLADYAFEFLYDFNPGIDTPDNQLGFLNPVAVFSLSPSTTPTRVEESQNLTFSFFEAMILGIIEGPTNPLTFDPFAIGEFTFKLKASLGGSVLGVSSINVVTTPLPSALYMFPAGLLGLAFVARRRRRKAPVKTAAA